MRNVFKVLLLVAIVLSACESEQRRSNTATGMLALHLAASPDVINTTTRVEEGSGDKVENTEEDELVPDVGDFTIALMDGKVVKTSWDKFSEYPKYAVLPVGAYTLKAYYGSEDKEGFDLPYYEGTQEVTIEDDETIEANITCYLTNVKVSVECTDAFKKYFSDYSTTVQSSGGNPVVFAKGEMRAAYIKPGAVTVYASVKKQNSNQFVRLNVLDIEEAKAREFYRLKLDIDAGSATLKISFDNTTVDQPVEINVSDDVLNMQAPFFTRSGYESGVMQEVKEGSAISPLSMLITARNGIKKCVLTTSSTSLINQGWPTSIDLVNPVANELEKIKALGLSMRGLSANVDKMATLDFSEIIPNLLSEDGEATFALTVTDKIGRVNATDETIKVNVLDNQFAVSNMENVDLGVYELTVPITLDGDITRVKFQYLKDNVWTNINVSDIASDNIQHKVKLSLPFMASENFQIKVICGARFTLAAIGVNPPVFTLQASEGDMWATKATIHIVGKNEGTTEYMKNQPVVIEYIKASELETGDWITPAQTKYGSSVEITGLPADPDKTNAYKVRATSGDLWATNVLDITTERAMQVPNSDFEEWYSYRIRKANGWGGKDIYTFCPYLSSTSSEDRWWETSNLTTTQEKAATWYYAMFPGTVPTAESGWTASNHLNKSDGKSFKIEAMKNKVAMEIATVGWGNNSWAFSPGTPEYVTPGCLYIGTYDENNHQQVYGKPFNSRPVAVEFYYKYYSYNNDKTTPYVLVKAADGSTIGYGLLRIEQSVANFTKGVIYISYEDITKKAATFTVVFLSSDKPEGHKDGSDSARPPYKSIKGSAGALSGYNDSRHIGSVLTVDDVKLVY